MKNRIPTFLAGMFTMLLLGTLTISALAISGRMTIEVDPINIQVNGVVFQPKDLHNDYLLFFSVDNRGGPCYTLFDPPRRVVGLSIRLLWWFSDRRPCSR